MNLLTTNSAIYHDSFILIEEIKLKKLKNNLTKYRTREC